MGCSSCGNKVLVNRSPGNVISSKHKVSENIGPCEYNNEVLQNFYNQLIYFKDYAVYVKYKIPAKTVNKYIGIVLTSMNVSNKCMYRDTLEKISDLVDLIISIR